MRDLAVRNGTIVRLAGMILLASVVLAAAKVVLAALSLLFLIVLTWGVCRHPQQAFAFVGLVTVTGLVKAYPLLTLSIIGVAVIVAHVAKGGGDPA